jgi:hypothetical protein
MERYWILPDITFKFIAGFNMGIITAKGGDTLTNQILRFYDDYVFTNITFQKIHFFIYILISKKGTNLILLNIIQTL